VAKSRWSNHDRLRESSDWNKSNPRKVVTAPDEVALEADSSLILARGPMNSQIIEIIDELVEVALRERRGGFQLHVDEEMMEIALAICDADPRAKNQSCTLRRF
jgi:hypothetical protein